jgi:hypothetical protein
MAVELPHSLQINAWTTRPPAPSPLAATWTRWATASHMVDADLTLAAPEPVDDRDVLDPRVGWGLVVVDDDALSEADRARGVDLPPVLRELVAARKGVVLRYRDEARSEFLRRYYTDGRAQDLSLSDLKKGTARGSIPKYLLLWASPAPGGSPGYIPWRFQYVLNGPRYVGRLHLEGAALDRYVSAVLDDWTGSAVRPEHPVIWAVDHSANDPNEITHLMRQVIAEPVQRALAADAQVGARVRYLSGSTATAAQLSDALADTTRASALVVTTSHGQTGPSGDPAAMADTLGLLVDQAGALVTPAALLARWRPDGAIWYAHACCSAGSDDLSQYDDLVPDGEVKDILRAVAGLGAMVAPLPTALLGADRPLRAFVGHVEPTFDWTLRHPKNKEPLTTAIRDALYAGMYRARPEPVGMAFARVFTQVGHLFAQFHLAKVDATAIDPQRRLEARAAAFRTQLGALDRQACVILGDPAVALPAL